MGQAKMDRLSGVGILCGFGALIGAQFLEGGQAAALWQGPAAVIVLLGTLGATFLASGEKELRNGLRELRSVFKRPAQHIFVLPEQFRDMALIARKDGLVSLDRSHQRLPTRFMSRALRHVIDGCDDQQLHEILVLDRENRTESTLGAARVFETAGGYAPTMGILGAVLGLIRAMEALSDPTALGQGIAVAFIATIYGVGLANLLLLPIAAKIRLRCQQQRHEDNMVIEGMLGLQAGTAPRTLERLLNAHLVEIEGSDHES